MVSSVRLTTSKLLPCNMDQNHECLGGTPQLAAGAAAAGSSPREMNWENEAQKKGTRSSQGWLATNGCGHGYGYGYGYAKQ